MKMMMMCLHLHCCPASCYALGHIMDIASVNHTHRTEQEEATSKKSTGGQQLISEAGRRK
eukprot:scaffold6569_cov79-Skeletonema_marinoi.AAC.6